MRAPTLWVLTALVAAGCAPRQVKPVPVGVENGQVLPDASSVVAQARARAEAERARVQGERDGALTAALASCEGTVCDALGRGELALGMTEAQVMAATGTTLDGWRVRRADGATVMSPASSDQLPDDARGDVALVQIQGDRVVAYTYQTPQGPRVVRSPADATGEGRARAQADLLIDEGDRFAAAGDLDRALNRYDRASVLVEDPMLDYKIATILDKSLRPLEARMRYQQFLHQMELERIEAKGQAAGHLADAIARARERVLIIERNR